MIEDSSKMKLNLKVATKCRAFNEISNVLRGDKISNEEKFLMIDKIISNAHLDIRVGDVAKCRKSMNFHKCFDCNTNNRSNKKLFCKYICAMRDISKNKIVNIDSIKVGHIMSEITAYGSRTLIDLYQKIKRGE